MTIDFARASMLFSTSSATALIGLLCDSAMMLIAFQWLPMRRFPLAGCRFDFAMGRAMGKCFVKLEVRTGSDGAVERGARAGVAVHYRVRLASVPLSPINSRTVTRFDCTSDPAAWSNAW